MAFSGERLKVARLYMFNTIDNLIRALEEEHNLKVNKGMVSRWENGKATPREDNIKALVSCLSVPTDYLTGFATVGNTLKYLRFKNRLSIQELSKESGIDVDILTLIEDDEYYLERNELDKVGRVLGISNFYRYLKKNEGVKFPITLEEMEFEFQLDKAFPLVEPPESIDEKYSHIFERPVNLDILLESEQEIVYKNRVLDKNQKAKLKKMIELIFDENS